MIRRIDAFMLSMTNNYPDMMSTGFVLGLRKHLLHPARRLYLGPPFGRPPVPCLVNDWELRQMLRLIKRLQPKTIMEIGSYAGGTLWSLMNVAQRGTQVISVDMLVPFGDSNYPDFQDEQRIGHQFLWRTWAEEFGHRFELLAGDSSNREIVVSSEILMPTIDFLFIDGDHSEKGLRSDVKNYGLRSRVVAIHDISSTDNPDVGKVWNELKKMYHTREFIHPGQAGIGVVFMNVEEA